MNKLITTLLVSSLVFGGVTLAQADSERHEKGEGKYCDKGKGGKWRGSRVERMATELGLSEAQLKQVREIEAKYHPEIQALRDKMKVSRKSLRELMRSDSVSQPEVKKLTQQQGDLKAEKIMLRSQMRAEMDKVLTVEQRAKFKQMRNKHDDEHRGYRKMHND